MTYMTEQLPITITVQNLLSLDELAPLFNKIKSVINKLEAQFNFHALRANWYGDEEDILFIQLALETPHSLNQQKAALDKSAIEGLDVSEFSDDVLCCMHQAQKQLLCHIAITDSELSLLTSQPKLLTGFFETKLRKVLNLIANNQSLPTI